MESSTQLLTCSACFQRIGLWMYQPDYKPHRFNSDVDEEDEQQDRSLDLIQLHREHCPWRNPITQAAKGDYTGKCAQEILLDVLERYVDEQRRRSRGTIQGPVGEAESDAGATDDGTDSLALETMPSMPELSRAETEKHDKERLSKLRRLKTVLGFKKRAPPAV
jgi:hypothetical protein